MAYIDEQDEKYYKNWNYIRLNVLSDENYYLKNLSKAKYLIKLSLRHSYISWMVKR